jgi:hypothetical protein
MHPEEETMKKCFLLLAVWLVTLAMGYSADQGITVSSPYLATQWCTGKSLDIGWSLWGDWTKLAQDPDNRQVRIMLVQAGGAARPMVIAAKVPISISRGAAVGKFSWPIPLDFPPGDYRVRVMTLNRLFKGQSETFVITSCLLVVQMAPQKVRKPMTNVVFSPGRIGGRASAATQGNLIAGRKIRVLLKKGGALVRSTEYTLDAQGGANFQFTVLPLGTYEISVEKVASPPPADPSTMLNVCFNGTVPVQRTVVIASGSTDVSGQDFAIQYNIAFNMNGVCW